jgi:hypothetical protein
MSVMAQLRGGLALAVALVCERRTAKSLNLQFQVLKLENPPYDFDAAFRIAETGRAQMVLVLSSPYFIPQMSRIVELAKAGTIRIRPFMKVG